MLPAGTRVLVTDLAAAPDAEGLTCWAPEVAVPTPGEHYIETARVGAGITGTSALQPYVFRFHPAPQEGCFHLVHDVSNTYVHFDDCPGGLGYLEAADEASVMWHADTYEVMVVGKKITRRVYQDVSDAARPNPQLAITGLHSPIAVAAARWQLLPVADDNTLLWADSSSDASSDASAASSIEGTAPPQNEPAAARVRCFCCPFESTARSVPTQRSNTSQHWASHGWAIRPSATTSQSKLRAAYAAASPVACHCIYQSCAATTSSIAAFARHLRTQHAEWLVPADASPTTSETASTDNTGSSTAVSVEPASARAAPRRCPVAECGPCPTRYALTKHLRHAHGLALVAAAGHPTLVDADLAALPGDEFVCPYSGCDLVQQSLREIDLHLRAKHRTALSARAGEPKTLRCPMGCRDTPPSVDALRVHLEAAHGYTIAQLGDTAAASKRHRAETIEVPALSRTEAVSEEFAATARAQCRMLEAFVGGPLNRNCLQHRVLKRHALWQGARNGNATAGGSAAAAAAYSSTTALEAFTVVSVSGDMAYDDLVAAAQPAERANCFATWVCVGKPPAERVVLHMLMCGRRVEPGERFVVDAASLLERGDTARQREWRHLRLSCGGESEWPEPFEPYYYGVGARHCVPVREDDPPRVYYPESLFRVRPCAQLPGQREVVACGRIARGTCIAYCGPEVTGDPDDDTVMEMSNGASFRGGNIARYVNHRYGFAPRGNVVFRAAKLQVRGGRESRVVDITFFVATEDIAEGAVVLADRYSPTFDVYLQRVALAGGAYLTAREALERRGAPGTGVHPMYTADHLETLAEGDVVAARHKAASVRLYSVQHVSADRATLRLLHLPPARPEEKPFVRVQVPDGCAADDEIDVPAVDVIPLATCWDYKADRRCHTITTVATRVQLEYVSLKPSAVKIDLPPA